MSTDTLWLAHCRHWSSPRHLKRQNICMEKRERLVLPLTQLVHCSATRTKITFRNWRLSLACFQICTSIETMFVVVDFATCLCFLIISSANSLLDTEHKHGRSTGRNAQAIRRSSQRDASRSFRDKCHCNPDKFNIDETFTKHYADDDWSRGGESRWSIQLLSSYRHSLSYSTMPFEYAIERPMRTIFGQ